MIDLPVAEFKIFFYESGIISYKFLIISSSNCHDTQLKYLTIFKHLKDSPHSRALCSADNFHFLDHASTDFQLKIKETIQIQREQPPLNQQLHQVNLKLSF